MLGEVPTGPEKLREDPRSSWEVAWGLTPGENAEPRLDATLTPRFARPQRLASLGWVELRGRAGLALERLDWLSPPRA